MIVNQARLLAYLLDHMERSGSKLEPFYSLHASDVNVDTAARRIPGHGHPAAHEGS